MAIVAGRPARTLRPVFGSHLSIAGSMVNALNEAESLGLDCVQVFTKNQQQWKAKPLDPGMVREWHAKVRELGWHTGGPDGRGGIVSHASYLINLASVDDELWRKSIDLMREEIERCEALGIPYLVHHPGSFVGAHLAHGMQRIEDAYAQLFDGTRGCRTIVCVEGTAGAGSHIGGRFEHLRELRERIAVRFGSPDRVGICLDTCHLHAAGYDMSTRESAAAVLAEFDALCGIASLKALHLNDSKGRLASHLDRHEHIGEGWVGGGGRPHTGKGSYSAQRLKKSGFAAVLQDARLAGLPMILETPKGTDKRGKPLDAMNLERLRMLVRAGMEGKEGAASPQSRRNPRRRRSSAISAGTFA